MKKREEGTLVPHRDRGAEAGGELAADLGTMVINEPDADLATMKRKAFLLSPLEHPLK